MDKPKLVPSASKEAKENTEAKALPQKPVESKEVKPSLMTQREAVFLVISRVLREEKVLVSPNVAVKTLLTEAHLKKIYTGLTEGFRTKKIALKESESNKKKMADIKKMEVYIIGLVNNWLKRDPRLNGKPNTKK